MLGEQTDNCEQIRSSFSDNTARNNAHLHKKVIKTFDLKSRGNGAEPKKKFKKKLFFYFC